MPRRSRWTPGEVARGKVSANWRFTDTMLLRTNRALLDGGKCAWGLISVTVRARARFNLPPTEQDKIPFADGSSANASKEWGLPATKRRSQPKMKQENTTCCRLTDVKKSGSSATNRVPRQGDTGCRLKFESSASLYSKRLTTRACYANLELFCCLSQAESDQGTEELLERAHQRLRDPFHHSFTIGKVLGRILPDCGLWKESIISHWSNQQMCSQQKNVTAGPISNWEGSRSYPGTKIELLDF